YRTGAHHARQSVLSLRRRSPRAGARRRVPLSQPAVFGGILDCVARRAIGLVSHRWNRGDLFGLDHSRQVGANAGAHAVGAGLGSRTVEGAQEYPGTADSLILRLVVELLPNP